MADDNGGAGGNGKGAAGTLLDAEGGTAADTCIDGLNAPDGRSDAPAFHLPAGRRMGMGHPRLQGNHIFPAPALAGWLQRGGLNAHHLFGGLTATRPLCARAFRLASYGATAFCLNEISSLA